MSDPLEELVANYEVDTQFPTLSGIEHLQMLRLRSRLESLKSALSESQLERLHHADQQLLSQAGLFFIELKRFVDLEERRKQESIPSTEWWWYLDVIAHANEAAIVVG